MLKHYRKIYYVKLVAKPDADFKILRNSTYVITKNSSVAQLQDWEVIIKVLPSSFWSSHWTLCLFNAAHIPCFKANHTTDNLMCHSERKQRLFFLLCS